MAADEGERKLAAILAADVAGYSRLMGDDERATVASLKQAREVFKGRIEAHSGRLIDTAGDSVLAEFKSVVEAVQCAVEVQEKLGADNEPVPEHRKMHFRIGINLGDIIEEDDGTIYGDGVNVAARLEGLAPPGGIMIADVARQTVEGKLGVGLEDAGEHEAKNIANPVRAWRVLLDGSVAGPPPKGPHTSLGRPAILVGAVGALVVLVGLVTWQFTRLASPPPSEDQTVAQAVDPILAIPTGPSIAVLPFTNMSGGAEQDYFADGITEDLITGLSRFRDLLVIARNSTFQYKGQAVDVREVGRDLNVRFVLEGSIRRDADNVRVTAQLLDAKDGGHIWADTFDRKISAGSVFAIQDEITEQVVGQIAGMHGAISELREAEVRSAPPSSLSAYECVLLAYEFFRVLNADSHLRARDCLEAAVKTDPTYADAWGWLLQMYNEEYVDGFNPLPNSLDRALDAGLTALEIDANNQVAHWFLAWNYYFRHDLENFAYHGDRALALNPNNATMLADLSMPVAWAGDIEKADGMVRKAMRINPRFPGIYYFTLYHIHAHAGDYQQAAADAEKLASPGLYWMHVKAATAYGHLGRTDDARAAIDKLLVLYPDFAEKAREELESIYWPDPEYIDRYMEGLEKAGLFD